MIKRRYKPDLLLKAMLSGYFRLIKSLAFAIVLMLGAWSFSPPAYAAIPYLLPLSARIISADGGAVADGNVNITFRLYNQESSGTAIWTETQTVTVTNGIFAVELGSTTSLSSIDFNASGIYLGITVSNDSEMSPRKRVEPAPTALNSDKLQGITFGRSGSDLSIAAGLVPATTGTYNLGSSTKRFATIYVDTISATTSTISGSDSLAFTINTNQTTNNTDSSSYRYYLGPTLNDHAALQWTGPSNRFDLFSRISSSTLGDLRLANLTLTGNETVTGTLGVTGATTLSSTLGVTGAATLSSTLEVTGATTLSSTLNVTGATTLSSTLGVTGATTLSSTLGVTGAATLSSTLGVTGTTTLGITNVNGDSTAGNTDIALGDATTDQLTVTAAVASTILPLTDNTYNFGSATKRWANFYAANAFFDQVSTPNTTANDFVINSDNNTADAEDATLKFHLGTQASPSYAVLGWNSTSDYLYMSRDFLTQANTTFGDASGDTVTSNAAAWTFANATTVALNNAANSLNFDSNTLSIDALNNSVGIGTASPGSLLHVQLAADSTDTTNGLLADLDSVGAAGEFTASSGTQTAVRIAPTINQTSTAGYTALLVNSTETATGSGAKNLLDLQVGGSSRLLVQSGGNVGIGDTGPDSLLDILSATTGTDLIITNTNATDTDVAVGFALAEGTNTFTLGVDDSDSDKFKISTTALGTNDRFVIDSSGNVGIGDASPLAFLTVGSGDLFQVNSSGAIAAVVGITSSSNYVQSAGTFSLTSANTTQTTTSSAAAINVNSLTVGTGLYVASSSLTSGLLVDLQVSGTAAAASQTALNILTAGANATAAITTYGAQISNTHTNATSGTNIALYLNASGATTANYGLIVNAGNVGIGDTSPVAALTVGDGDDFQVSSTGVVTSNTSAAFTTLDTGQGANELYAMASQSDQETATSATTYVNPSIQENHPSAAKFWVKFAGADATVNASYNVTSVTRESAGNYTVTIATDFSSGDWVCLVSNSNGSGNEGLFSSCKTMAAGSIILESFKRSDGSDFDPVSVYVMGFGDQ